MKRLLALVLSLMLLCPPALADNEPLTIFDMLEIAADFFSNEYGHVQMSTPFSEENHSFCYYAPQSAISYYSTDADGIVDALITSPDYGVRHVVAAPDGRSTAIYAEWKDIGMLLLDELGHLLSLPELRGLADMTEEDMLILGVQMSRALEQMTYDIETLSEALMMELFTSGSFSMLETDNAISIQLDPASVVDSVFNTLTFERKTLESFFASVATLIGESAPSSEAVQELIDSMRELPGVAALSQLSPMTLNVTVTDDENISILANGLGYRINVSLVNGIISGKITGEGDLPDFEIDGYLNYGFYLNILPTVPMENFTGLTISITASDGNMSLLVSTDAFQFSLLETGDKINGQYISGADRVVFTIDDEALTNLTARVGDFNLRYRFSEDAETLSFLVSWLDDTGPSDFLFELTFNALNIALSHNNKTYYGLSIADVVTVTMPDMTITISDATNAFTPANTNVLDISITSGSETELFQLITTVLDDDTASLHFTSSLCTEGTEILTLDFSATQEPPFSYSNLIQVSAEELIDSFYDGLPLPGSETASAPIEETMDEITVVPQATPSTLQYVQMDIEGYGSIVMELDSAAAPITVDNFLKLVDNGFYNGLTFHRIISGFVMQGGDPLGNGRGGSDDKIKGEFSANGWINPISHTRGVLSMARSSAYDSASSQFFIMHGDATYLDGQYAAFGRVVSGMEIVDAICANTPVADNNGTVKAANQPVITQMTRIDTP